jgi:hypothetical protein
MKSHFSVYPRYTAGSPAGVSEELCRRVLREESAAMEYVLLGYVGAQMQRLAETKGLVGVAIERWESRNIVFSRDLSMGEITERNPKQWAKYTAEVANHLWRMRPAYEQQIDWTLVEWLNNHGVSAQDAAERIRSELDQAQSA